MNTNHSTEITAVAPAQEHEPALNTPQPQGAGHDLTAAAVQPQPAAAVSTAPEAVDNQPPPQRTAQAQQSREKAAYIAAAGTTLRTVLGNPTIMAALRRYGYDAAALQAGQVLQAQAQAGYVARQQALADRYAAQAHARTSRQATYAGYVDFRRVAGAVLPDAQDRIRLGLTGQASSATRRLITAATTSYTAAQENDYRAALSRRGYTPERLAAALAEVAAFTAACAARDNANVAARQALKQRDAAVTALQRWMSEFRAVARVALRGQPEAQAAAGL